MTRFRPYVAGALLWTCYLNGPAEGPAAAQTRIAPGAEQDADTVPSADQIFRALTTLPANSGRTLSVVPATPSFVHQIGFEFGRAALTPDARRLLDRLAEVLRRPELATSFISIVGHTDAVGTAGANRVLSERRAAAVRDHLVSTGLPDRRFEVIGRGESELADASRPNHAVNRRVVIINWGPR